MTWLQFALWVGFAYVIYYGIIIALDFRRQQPAGPEEDILTLGFEDPVTVTRPDPVSPVAVVSAIVGSGGLSLKQLFAECRGDAVECRKAVSY